MSPSMLRILDRITDTVTAGELAVMFKAVVSHRKRKADDCCKSEHNGLYKAFGLSPRTPDDDGKTYEELEKEIVTLTDHVENLQRINESHCARIHAQHEVIQKLNQELADERKKRQSTEVL